MRHTNTWSKEYDYKIDFRKNLEEGKQGEDYSKSLLTGKYKVETKTDYKCYETGNVFVEFQSRGKDSGIRVSTAEVWSFVLPKPTDVFPLTIYVSLEALKKMVENKKYKTVMGGDNKTSLGYLVPKEDIIQLNM